MRASVARPGAMPPRRSARRTFACSSSKSDSGVERVFEVVGPAAERVGEREQDAMDLFLLPFGERDDIVVDVHGRERLEIEARAACGAAVHDARNRVAVFRADDDDVAAVTVRDDLAL